MRLWCETAIAKIKSLSSQSLLWEDCGISFITYQQERSAIKLVKFSELEPDKWFISIDTTGCIEIEIRFGDKEYIFTVYPLGNIGYYFFAAGEEVGGGGVIILDRETVKDIIFPSSQR